jgi:DnaK suppressor protein
MEPKDLGYFKQLLSNELDELLDRAHRTVGVLVRDDDSAADLLDQAARESDRNYTLRIRDRESNLIRKIKLALEKFEDGSFGICESCGEEIALARLMARPVTAHCIQCKTRIEAIEKVSGF